MRALINRVLPEPLHLVVYDFRWLQLWSARCWIQHMVAGYEGFLRLLFFFCRGSGGGGGGGEPPPSSRISHSRTQWRLGFVIVPAGRLPSLAKTSPTDLSALTEHAWLMQQMKRAVGKGGGVACWFTFWSEMYMWSTLDLMGQNPNASSHICHQHLQFLQAVLEGD